MKDKLLKIERLKYAKLYLDNEKQIENMESSIASGDTTLEDIIKVSNEHAITLIAQRFKIKKSGGYIFNKSAVIENLEIDGDIESQISLIRKTLDDFFPNATNIELSKNENGNQDIYILSDVDCIEQVVLNIKSVLFSEINKISYFDIQEKNQMVCGINNKIEAIAFINECLEHIHHPIEGCLSIR